jgi:hypothetical protein
MRLDITRRLAILGIAAAAAVLLPACSKKEPAHGRQSQPGRSGTAETQAAKYVCPMHAEVTSTSPGKCSKCGMDLVPADASPPASDSAGGGERSETGPGRERTIVGEVVDVSCFGREGLLGDDHEECAKRCIQAGAPVGIVERQEGGKATVYVAIAEKGASARSALLPYVARRVEVHGRTFERGGARFLEVMDVTPEHEHSARHGGVVGMSGPLHVETVAYQDGEVRVYLSDAFRKSLQAAGLEGEVEIPGPQGVPRKLPLEAGPNGAYLRARSGAPFGTRTVEVTVRLAKPHEFLMTSALAPRRAPGAGKEL